MNKFKEKNPRKIDLRRKMVFTFTKKKWALEEECWNLFLEKGHEMTWKCSNLDGTLLLLDYKKGTVISSD